MRIPKIRYKCCLCERTVDHGAFEIDHRDPKDQTPARRTDWTNLYPACDKCNGRRWRKARPGGWLHPEDDAEGRLIQRIDHTAPKKLLFDSVDPNDHPARNAADELDHLHCGDDIAAADIRNALFVQLDVIAEQFQAYIIAPDPTDRARAERLLRRLLSRRAPFTALIRSRYQKIDHLFD